MLQAPGFTPVFVVGSMHVIHLLVFCVLLLFGFVLCLMPNVPYVSNCPFWIFPSVFPYAY
jgi:hypothetical protein